MACKLPSSICSTSLPESLKSKRSNFLYNGGCFIKRGYASPTSFPLDSIDLGQGDMRRICGGTGVLGVHYVQGKLCVLGNSHIFGVEAIVFFHRWFGNDHWLPKLGELLHPYRQKITSFNFQAFISGGSAKDLYLRCMYLLPICLGIGDKDLASALMECWTASILFTSTPKQVENLLVHTILEGLEVRHYYYRLIKRMNKFDARDSKDVVALEKFKCSSFKLHFEASTFTTALEQHRLKDRKKDEKKIAPKRFLNPSEIDHWRNWVAALWLLETFVSILSFEHSSTSWNSKDVMCAADVYDTVGRRQVFRLRFGWCQNVCGKSSKSGAELSRDTKIILNWILNTDGFGQRLWRDEDLLGASSVDRFIVLNDASKHDADRYSLTPSRFMSAACSLLGTSQGTSSSDLLRSSSNADVLRSSALDLYWADSLGAVDGTFAHGQSLLLNGNSSLGGGISTSLFPDSLDEQTPGVLLSPNDIQMVEVDRQ
ncbi:hypothetical protein SELMODRAFT_424293 [Selaginella moellendorffii]|uniref:Uncharacterized protein n=1 Tax=Selaginella moellendorffii TaxID=88036 RepID=D8SPF1_SELML|nr:hypothetical protein SELMODRAFT_424293 [Selaginella moellendorffii]